MPGFRRAHIRGSDELFRSRDEPQPVEQTTIAEMEPAVHPVPAAPPPDERSVRLSEAEIDVLVEALQHLKFPGKSSSRPSMDDYERLEELRQKLISSR